MNVLTLNKNCYFLFLFLLPGCNCLHDSKSSAKTEESEAMAIKVINVLDKELYNDCHIKGSVSVPFMDPDDSSKSPIESYAKDLPKDTKLVIYCSNYMCSASGEIAKKLNGMGFANVWAYEAGMADWYQKGLPVEGSCKQDYLTKVMDPPKEHSGFKVISTDGLKEMIKELR